MYKFDQLEIKKLKNELKWTRISLFIFSFVSSSFFSLFIDTRDQLKTLTLKCDQKIYKHMESTSLNTSQKK
jgi:hypothetical protein